MDENNKNKDLGGRPAFFNTPEELQKKIEDYILNCPDTKEIKKIDNLGATYYEKIPSYTITGLAYFLGFESRQSFYDYEERGAFSYVIKRARFFIEKEYEKLLQSGVAISAMFVLKNMGWKDKTEVESINTNNNQSVIYVDKESSKNLEEHINKIINNINNKE